MSLSDNKGLMSQGSTKPMLFQAKVPTGGARTEMPFGGPAYLILAKLTTPSPLLTERSNTVK